MYHHRDEEEIAGPAARCCHLNMEFPPEEQRNAMWACLVKINVVTKGSRSRWINKHSLLVMTFVTKKPRTRENDFQHKIPPPTHTPPSPEHRRGAAVGERVSEDEPATLVFIEV